MGSQKPGCLQPIFSLPDNSPVTRRDEGDESADSIGFWKLLAELFQRLRGVLVAAVDDFISLAEFTDGFGAESPAFQSDHVDPAYFGGIPVGDEEGRDILDDLRATPDDRMIPDAAELVDPTQTSNHGMIPDGYMSREGSVVGENDMATNGAVMGNMGVGQKGAVAADSCDRFGSRASVDRHKFPEGIVIADFQIGRFLLVFQILGTLADRAEGIKFIPIADMRWAGNGDMIVHPASLSKSHSCADDAIGTDCCRRTDDGRWINDGCGMNRGHSGLFVDDTEEQDAFADDLTVDEAFAGGFAEASFGADHVDMDEEGVTGEDGLAEFHLIGTHKVADFSRVLGFAHHDNRGYLGHCLDL